MNVNIVKRSLMAISIAVVFAAGYANFRDQGVGAAHAAPTTPAVASPASVRVQRAAALPDFSTIVDRIGPAVVNISVTGQAQATAMSDDPSNPLHEFFRRFGVPVPHDEGPSQGMGSGFIVSADGVVLTNAHVVDDAAEVMVRLTDKREFEAKVIGIDKVTDIAVLRIDAKDLPVVRLGNPGGARVGEWVVAIGSPFGFENSVTAGIVSAKSRLLSGDSYVPFIQTDVAVNPGNSGGPLINLDGEVIGVNSQIYSRSGGYQGVSFAIPIDVAMKVEEQLVRHGKVSHGRMGVMIQEVSPALAQSFGLKGSTGALVSGVEKGSPAATAGLQPGDIILKLDDTEIGRSAELPPLIAAIKPGTQVKLKVWRKGSSHDRVVAVGEMEAPRLAASTRPAEPDQSPLGLAVRPLDGEERQQTENPDGLLVENVSAAAAKAGIRPGDLIISVNGQSVHDVGELRSLIDKAGRHVALLIERGEARIFVPLDLG